MRKEIIIALCLFLISIPSVLAVGQVTNFYFEQGITIVSSPQTDLKQNQSFQINFFAFNTTTGALLDNSTVNCSFFLADGLGDVLLYSDVPYLSDGYWGLNITGGNFSGTGEYNYGVKCEGSGLGGAMMGAFFVTPTGIILSSAQSGLSLGIMLSIVLLTFFFGFLSYKLLDKEKTFPFGLFFLLIALILAIYTLYLGTLFSQDFLLESTKNVQSTIFVSIMYSLVGISFIGLLFLILKVLKEIKERKSIQKYGRGFDPKTKTYR